MSMSEPRLPFERRGAGAPPIVFVHGSLCSRDDWRHQVAHFERAHETIAVDLPGMGQTSPHGGPLGIETLGQDVADLLEQEDLAGVVLVAHSMGCRVAVEAAVRAPERVAGLVLVEGSRIQGDRDAVFAAYDEAAAEGRFMRMMAGRYRYMFFGEVPDWGEELLERIADLPQDAAVTMSKSSFEHDQGRLLEAMSQVQAPVLIIQSTAPDPGRGLRPVQEDERVGMQRLAEEAGVTFDIFRHIGPGHFNMIEDPDTVNARIAEFIAIRVSA